MTLQTSLTAMSEAAARTTAGRRLTTALALALAATLGCAARSVAPGGPGDGGANRDEDAPQDQTSPRRCARNTDCAANEQCVFEAGCGTLGSCQPAVDCDGPVAYCGCDRVTFMDCPATRPFVHQGPCTRPDGGPPRTTCMRNEDCGPDHLCAFERGCDGAPRGRCVTPATCASPLHHTFCGCDGRSFPSTGGCALQPYSHQGGC